MSSPSSSNTSPKRTLMAGCCGFGGARMRAASMTSAVRFELSAAPSIHASRFSRMGAARSGRCVVQVAHLARVAREVEELPGAVAHVPEELVRRRVESLDLERGTPRRASPRRRAERDAPPSGHARVGPSERNSAGASERPDTGAPAARPARLSSVGLEVEERSERVARPAGDARRADQQRHADAPLRAGRTSDETRRARRRPRRGRPSRSPPRGGGASPSRSTASRTRRTAWSARAISSS